jgi:DNA-binding NarL/FixJ family response regulator
VRVVIAEDLALLRDGLIRILEAFDFEVVEAVDNAPALLRALLTHRPEVAVVDVRMPPTFTDEGLRAAIEARAQVPGLPVLVLSQYVEQLYARELLSDRRGGVGYLLKDRVSNVGQFIDAVRRVAAGGTAMDPEVVSALLSRRTADEPLATLTPREREVLALMAEAHEQCHRRADVRDREGDQQTQREHLRQARARSVGGRQPPGTGRAGLSAGVS